MINLSTPAVVIHQELLEDKAKVERFCRKKFGKGLADLKIRLIKQARLEKRHVLSRLYEYVSPNGNRWLCYWESLYKKDTKECEVYPMHVCVYRTVGSIGVFRMKSLHDFSGATTGEAAVIYTSHFFLRYAERKGLSIDDERLIPAFLQDSILTWFTFHPVTEDGTKHVDTRFPGGVGRGVVIQENPKVIEIRTYLNDTQLSFGQKRRIGDLIHRENYDGKENIGRYLDRLVDETNWVPRSVEDMWHHRHFKSVTEFNWLYRNRLLLLLIESGCSSERATAMLVDHIDLIMEEIFPLFKVFQQSGRLDHAGFASLCLSLLSREGIEPKLSKDDLIAWQEELLERNRKALEKQLGRKVVYRHEIE